MADLSVTVAEVQKPTIGSVDVATAGGTLTAGQPIYLDANDSNKAKAAAATSSSLAKVVGIALHGALSGQPVEYQKDGVFIVGATAAPAVGKIYVLSGSAGGMSPHTDATTPATGEFTTIIGVGLTSSTIKLGILASGVAVA